MKVTEHLERAKGPLFSFEILPPLKGESIQMFFDAIDPLMEFNPAFIDVTYHREEYVYKQRGNDGLLEKITTKKRPGTVGVCAAIANRYEVDTVPHLICGGFNKRDTENALFDLNFLGVQNVLLLRGDAIKSEARFVPDPNGHDYASDLVEQVVNMNKGQYLAEEIETPTTDFCIGVAGYPEKHFEAPNLENDLKYLKMKVDMGAEYVVTQMFFDNQKYFDFVNKCRDMGITVPIIPGLKPMVTKKQLTILPSIFHLDLPQALAQEVEKCKDNKAVRQVGIEWCIQQSKELLEFGAPCLHYYTMSKSGTVKAIASEVF
ncbi:methylenetetrahydrofolate reductase [NAD(P)H] [Flammeovirgaceae bacterium SG7u.111]|nr:methylenetetrahydrofolate reductase [NAD(P)H] [Flammeovirgaceae bacterium SG7u.132]WPO35126.1 methylenetetrahydrofolate reductase [NAD(P)H] [Flammeovirgaceae bacterium SG7u.111]